MTDKITEIKPQVTVDEEVITEAPPVFYAGKELKLKYTLWSLIQLKEAQGIDLNDLQDEEADTDFSTIVKMVWAGMINEYPDVTFPEVAMAFEMSDIQGLSAELNRAMSSSTAVGKPALSAGLISQ